QAYLDGVPRGRGPEVLSRVPPGDARTGPRLAGGVLSSLEPLVREPDLSVEGRTVDLLPGCDRPPSRPGSAPREPGSIPRDRGERRRSVLGDVAELQDA